MRRSRLIQIVLGVISIAALGHASAFEFDPWFVWNVSASAPVGLYRIAKRAPKVDDFVLIRADRAIARIITERRYIPPEIPLLKRIAALPGAVICREETAILIDGNYVADALVVDSLVRKMPVWSGCFALKSDEIFLLNAPERSLDGRYFGATNSKNVIGVATPIFTLHADQ